MKDILKGNTSINEYARRDLGITRDDYSLCSYIQYRAAAPKQQRRGFCCDPKQDIADFVGISRPGLYKMIDRLSGLGLISSEAGTGALSITDKWLKHENSVNKVYKTKETECKQSLQRVSTKFTDGVNKVTLNKIDKIDKSEQQKGVGDFSPLEEEKENTPPIPAAPPAPSAPAPQRYGFDPVAEYGVIAEDVVMRETLQIVHRVPAKLFDAYLDAFRLNVAATGTTHNNRQDMRTHFFNFCRSRYKAEGSNPTTTTGYTAPAPNVQTPAYVP